MNINKNIDPLYLVGAVMSVFIGLAVGIFVAILELSAVMLVTHINQSMTEHSIALLIAAGYGLFLAYFRGWTLLFLASTSKRSIR